MPFRIGNFIFMYDYHLISVYLLIYFRGIEFLGMINVKMM